MAPFLTSIEKIYLAGSDSSRRAYVFVASAERPLQSRLGTVFGLVELNGLAEPLSEKIFEIVRDLEIEYYLPPFDINEPHERRFEECLQRANRRLGRTIQDSIERVNVERITALVGLISQNKLHLSTIGPAGAFLFHRRRRYDQVIIDIIDQGSDKQAKINPEKLFSNIISGAIGERDQVVCCNDTVLEYVAQSEISSIIEDKVPSMAGQALESRLTDLDGTFTALIIAPQLRETNTAPTEAVPSSLQPQHSINRLITTQAKTEAYLTPSLMPSWKKVLVLSGNQLKAGMSGVASGIGSLTQRVQRSRSTHTYRPDTELPPPVRERVFEAPPTPPVPPEATAIPPQNWDDLPEFEDDADEVLERTHTSEVFEAEINAPLTIRPTISPATVMPKLGSAFTGAISGIKQNPRRPLISLSNGLNRLIASYVRLPRLQQIILAIAFVCLFIFSLSIVVAGQTGTSGAKNVDAQFRAVEDKLATAEAQNIFNDEAGAQTSLAAAQDLFNQIPDKRAIRDRRQALEKRLNDLKQTFLKITTIENPKLVTELAKTNASAQAATLAATNDALYSFDSNNQSLYKINPTTGEVSATKIEATDIRQLNTDGSTLYLLSGARQVLRFASNAATSVLSTDTDLAAIGGYGSRLYTLRTNGTIYRHQSVTEGFNSGNSWLRGTPDMTNATTIAIDGGIYVGRGNTITSFISGNTQPSSFTPLDPPIDVAQITASIDSNYLYILDRTNKRIVAYDKKGTLKMQFVSPTWNDMKAIAVNDKAKTIYVLSDQKIYSVSIPF